MMRKSTMSEQEADEQATQGEHPLSDGSLSAPVQQDPRDELPTEVYPTPDQVEASNLRRDNKRHSEKLYDPEVPKLRAEKEKALAKAKRNGYIPHIILGAIAAIAIVALAVMAFVPTAETQFIQNTLGSIALAATAALAGIVRGPGA